MFHSSHLHSGTTVHAGIWWSQWQFAGVGDEVLATQMLSVGGPKYFYMAKHFEVDRTTFTHFLLLLLFQIFVIFPRIIDPEDPLMNLFPFV